MKAGDVLVAAFPGARITKTRPDVVLSTEEYHRHRPDVVLGLLTTKATEPLTPTDCEIRDWRAAGLHAPSLFRLFVVTLPQREVRVVGRLSDRDWRSVLDCIRTGLGCQQTG